MKSTPAVSSLQMRRFSCNLIPVWRRRGYGMGWAGQVYTYVTDVTQTFGLSPSEIGRLKFL